MQNKLGLIYISFSKKNICYQNICMLVLCLVSMQRNVHWRKIMEMTNNPGCGSTVCATHCSEVLQGIFSHIFPFILKRFCPTQTPLQLYACMIILTSRKILIKWGSRRGGKEWPGLQDTPTGTVTGSRVHQRNVYRLTWPKAMSNSGSMMDTPLCFRNQSEILCARLKLNCFSVLQHRWCFIYLFISLNRNVQGQVKTSSGKSSDP